MDYANGKIYKITGSGMTYYGSTTQALSKRFWSHKHHKNTTSKNIIETGDAVIVLVELYPCKSKEELYMRERYYIENNECVNKQIPLRTQKQYYENNKEKRKQQSKETRIINYDELKLYHKQYNENNKEKRNKYRIDNADKIKERKKQYNIDNADKIKEQRKEYYKINKERILEQQKQKRKERYKLLGK